ncbi:MAG TPA: undecaprenyl-phosphate glucose phosphotransferase [Steroidobacteraceae bacterium]|nr:undecaprenyl-phosphate glucose phosphotransferase [Steroidobacteraceae bacterium]
MLYISRHTEPAPNVTANDPSGVFVVKSLLYPLVAVATLCASLLWWREYPAGPYFLLGVLAFITVAEFLDVAPLDRKHSASWSLSLLLDICLRWSLVVLFLWALLYLSGLAAQYRSEIVSAWALVTPAALWASRMGARWLLVQASEHGMPQRKAVIIGLTDVGATLADRLLEDPLLRTEVLGFFEDRHPSRLTAKTSHPILGTSLDAAAFIAGHEVSVVYICLPMSRSARIENLLESLRDCTASIYFAPDLIFSHLIQPRFDQVRGIPLVAVRESPFYGMRGAAKRLFDIGLAGTLIALLSPVLATIAVGVKLTSAGPVIFRQKRYGLDGKEIIVYKFRSMSVTEDGETAYTQVSRGDARVTPFGAFLRRTSLDELPQLFNVLEGSMSIVGPRPHAIAVNEQYRRLIPSYMIRHKVKPGITGWAQIHGYRGGDDLELMKKRVEFDIDYLRNWSLALDFSILIKTVAVVWRDSSAY